MGGLAPHWGPLCPPAMATGEESSRGPCPGAGGRTCLGAQEAPGSGLKERKEEMKAAFGEGLS